MNFLPKAFLALSLIAVVPAMEAFPSFASMKGKAGEWLTSFSGFVSSKNASRKQVSSFVRNRPKTSAAIAVGTIAGLAGAGYLAKKHNVHGKIASAVGAPKRLAKSAYDRFAKSSKSKKAGVVIGGIVVAAGAAYLAKTLWSKYHNTKAETNL